VRLLCVAGARVVPFESQSFRHGRLGDARSRRARRAAAHAVRNATARTCARARTRALPVRYAALLSAESGASDRELRALTSLSAAALVEAALTGSLGSSGCLGWRCVSRRINPFDSFLFVFLSLSHFRFFPRSLLSSPCAGGINYPHAPSGAGCFADAHGETTAISLARFSDWVAHVCSMRMQMEVAPVQSCVCLRLIDRRYYALLSTGACGTGC
jgi:hypothetical protein